MKIPKLGSHALSIEQLHVEQRLWEANRASYKRLLNDSSPDQLLDLCANMAQGITRAEKNYSTLIDIIACLEAVASERQNIDRALSLDDQVQVIVRHLVAHRRHEKS